MEEEQDLPTPEQLGDSDESHVELVRAEPVQPKPWSFWETFGWGALGAILVTILQTIMLIPFVLERAPLKNQAELERVAEELASDGWALAIISLVTAAVVWLYVTVISRLRGWRARDYLAMEPLRWRSALTWTAALVLLVVAIDATTYALGREFVTQFQIDAYNTSRWPWLLLIAVVVGAPVGEELMFRGFLYRGFAESLGAPVAILLTSFSWAIIHLQYDAYGIGVVFLLGIFLGIVRHRTKSTSLTMLLHAVANMIASAETVWVVHQ